LRHLTSAAEAGLLLGCWCRPEGLRHPKASCWFSSGLGG